MIQIEAARIAFRILITVNSASVSFSAAAAMRSSGVRALGGRRERNVIDGNDVRRDRG